MGSRAAVEIILKARDDASKTLAKFGKEATKLGKTLTRNVTLPLLAIGTAAVMMATDMDREMRNIQSISKATDTDIAALSQTFVDMSTDLTVTTDSAVKLAEGFYTIQGSGFAGADAMTVLEVATKAASAGLTDTEVAAKAVTSALNAYGESADQAAEYADLMFRTVDIGVGTFEELSSSLGYVVGTASQAGISFDEISAALSTMSKQGIEFHKGGRALNMLLLALIKPSEELADALLDIGYESGQAALDALGLAGTLQALEQAGYGGTEGFAALGLSSMALRSALALTGTGADMFAEDLAAMQTASEGAGAAQEAFAIQTQSFSAQLANFKNIIYEAGITLGNILLPVLSDLLNYIKPLIQRFSELDPEILKIIVAVAGLAAAAGPVLLILGQMAIAIGALGPVFSLMASAIGLAVTQVGILTGAATMLQAALITMIPLAVLAGLVLLAKHSIDAAKAVNETFSSIETSVARTAQSYEEYKRQVIEAAVETHKLRGTVEQFIGMSDELFASLGKSRAEWEASREAIEGKNKSLRIMTEGLIEYTHQQEQTTKVVAEAAKIGADAADIMRAGWGTLADEISFYGKAMETDMGEVARASKEMAKAVTEVYDELGNIVQQFGEGAAKSIEAYARQVEQALQQHRLSLRESEIKYQRSRQELIARANAEIAALEAAGLGDKAAERQAQLDEELAMLEYNYETQKAWAAWHWEIQLKMQQYARAQQLADQAAYFQKELEMWYAQSRAKLTALGGEVAAMGEGYLSLARIAATGTQSIVASANTHIDALAALSNSYRSLKADAAANLSKAQADMARLMGEIDVLIEAGPALPDIPDFSQWVGDYSAGMSSAGSQVRESATKTLQEVTVDIAKAFEVAMAVFEQVAGWKPLEGLAAGMKLLREDIQLAVSEMYTAYQALGEDGVQGAQLIAVAAVQVFEAIGQAVDTFAKLAEYSAPLRSALDSVLADVKYVLVKVRTELLDLWGWAGAREDTVWGHMESWASAVGEVVELIGQAVEAFEGVKQYTGIMPGTIALLVADIKEVVSEMVAAIGDGGGVDELKVQWAQFAGDLISAVAGMMSDLETIAAYTGGLAINQNRVRELIRAMRDAAITIIKALPDVTDYWADGVREVEELKAEWLQFNTGLISTVAGMMSDLETIASYGGGLEINQNRVRELIRAMRDAAITIVKALPDLTDYWADGVREVEELKAEWLEFNAGLISTVARMMDDLADIAAFEGGLIVTQSNVENLINTLKDIAGWILDAIGEVGVIFTWATREVDELKAAWLELAAGLISTIASIIEDIKKIAAFEGVEEAAFKVSLDSLFNALYWFLDEFELRANDFAGIVSKTSAEIAKLMGETVASLGATIEPLLAVATFAITPAEAETAIGLFFEALEMFLKKFDEKATDFEGKVSQEVADLAKIIGDTVSGLGSAVEPLVKILEYNPEVKNIEAQFDKFFAHLNTALTKIETEKTNWVIADDAAALAARIAEVMEDLKAAVDFLTAMGKYSEEEAASALTGFQSFLGDLKDIVDTINDAKNKISDDALGAAAQFALDCNQILTDITAGIDKLNLLADLGTEPTNLVQAGIALVTSLADGFIAASSSQWGRIISEVQSLVNRIIAQIYRVPTHIYIAVAISNIHAAVNGIIAELARIPRTINVNVNVSGGSQQELASYQHGGTVPGPIGMPQLAVVHGGERYLGRGGAGRGGGLSKADAELFAKELMKEFMAAGTMRGDTTINVETADPGPVARQIELAQRRLNLQAQLSASRG